MVEIIKNALASLAAVDFARLWCQLFHAHYSEYYKLSGRWRHECPACGRVWYKKDKGAR